MSNNNARLLGLIRKESPELLREMLVAAGISGLASAAILIIVNAAEQVTATGRVSLMAVRFGVMFGLVAAAYVVSLRVTFNRSAQIFEGMVEKIRTRVLDKVRHSDLVALETIGPARIHTFLTQDLLLISNLEGRLSAAVQAAVLMLFVSIYIAYLSGFAFLLTVGLSLGGVVIHLRGDREYRKNVERNNKEEIKFFGLITHLFKGFREVKVNQRRSAALAADLREVSRDLKTLKMETTRLYSDSFIKAQCFFYCLVALVVFVLPRLVPTDADVIAKTTMSILFIIGPLSQVVGVLPDLSKASLAVEHLFSLEAELDQHHKKRRQQRSADASGPLHGFERISVDQLEFTYTSEVTNETFTVGPLSFHVDAGEILMITGGNGSGKTTLLKVLTTLYFPDKGTIAVDGLPILEEDAQRYREMFSVVFSDFHLFEKLYGFDHPDRVVVDTLLQRMRLEGKTDVSAGRFTNLALSTGQRKRLALLVTLLEDRPIIVLDEWAAEQDPEFRQFFYEELLAELKSRNKTIIAISHDDKYFRCADRVIRLEFGRIVSDMPVARA